MIKTCSSSKYFTEETGFSLEAVANQLNLDLVDKIESIYEAVQNVQSHPSDVLLQSTKNSLRRSVEQIHLEEGPPFFKNKGQCRGACEWFIALFLNFKQKHPQIPTDKLLTEIAKEFADGVGIQGACLQKSYQEDLEHQNMIRALKFDLEEKAQLTPRNDLSMEILKTVYELEEGAYLLSFSGRNNGKAEESFPGHATAIIIENGNYYFFDPNVGLAGTGREIGTENKTKDVAFFLAMCGQYSPYSRADALFKKGLKNLSETLSADKAEIVQKVFGPEFRKDGQAYYSTTLMMRALFDRYDRFESIAAFSLEEKKAITHALSISPGLMQNTLERSNTLKLKKCVFLE